MPSLPNRRVPAGQEEQLVFQFPTRNSGFSNATAMVACWPTCTVSIPHSEFWIFKPDGDYEYGGERRGFQFPTRNSGFSNMSAILTDLSTTFRFNSPLGILAFQTGRLGFIPGGRLWFQFPTRNSGFSNPAVGPSPPSPPMSFNSPLGILDFQTHPGLALAASEAAVSIPHSEFWIFKRRYWGRARRERAGFNSPLGILDFQTESPPAYRPQRHTPCFNSPLGILDFQTRRGTLQETRGVRFQFPTRNSGFSNSRKTGNAVG